MLPSFFGCDLCAMLLALVVEILAMGRSRHLGIVPVGCFDVSLGEIHQLQRIGSASNAQVRQFSQEDKAVGPMACKAIAQAVSC